MPGLWDKIMGTGKKAAKKGAKSAKGFDRKMVESHGGDNTDQQETFLAGAPSRERGGEELNLGIGPMDGGMNDDEAPGVPDAMGDNGSRWEGGQPEMPGNVDEDREYNFPDLF